MCVRGGRESEYACMCVCIDPYHEWRLSDAVSLCQQPLLPRPFVGLCQGQGGLTQ